MLDFDLEYYLNLPFYVDRLKQDGYPIVLYGTGNGGDRLFEIFSSYGLEICDVFASSGFVRDRYFHGFHVSSFEEMVKKYPKMSVILAFGSQKKEVVDYFYSLADKVPLYCPEIMMDNGRLFDKEYLSDHEEEYRQLWNRLADDRSRQVMKDIFSYRITADIHYLKDAENEVSDNWNLLEIGGDEVFMDLGAYNGDTIELFLSKSGNRGKLIAVEPDRKNFRKLMEHCYEGLEAYNTLIGRAAGTASFTLAKGRGARKGKGVELPVESVDHILSERRLSILKLDVEGEEENALIGARETIRREHPRMLVSAYHKLTDLTRLSSLVLSIDPFYKMYLRGTPSVPSWDLAFYFV